MEYLVSGVLLLVLLSSCSSSKVYLDTKLVVQHDSGSDWMLRPERPWIADNNNPRLHAELGLAWKNQIDCPYIATGTDKLNWVHIGCGKTWGSYKSSRKLNFFARLDVVHQVDELSSWWLSTDRKDWSGHNPFMHGRVGLEWKHQIKCPVYATGKSIFQGFPFESEDEAPDLYWSYFECTKRWGGWD